MEKSENENQATVENANPVEAPKKSKSFWWVLVIVVLIVLIYSVNFFFPLSGLISAVSDLANGRGASKNLAKTEQSSTVDQNIVGNWDTGCLIPKIGDPWAERHTFTISSDGTANHKRYTGVNCDAMAVDHDDDMKLSVPSMGKVDISYTKGIAAGGKVYDVYQVSGNTLKFGHGFCNCTKDLAGGTFGQSDDKRPSLNDFLAYKKQ